MIQNMNLFHLLSTMYIEMLTIIYMYVLITIALEKLAGITYDRGYNV